jgi:hypothetical protein
MKLKLRGAGMVLHVFPSMSTMTNEAEEPEVVRCKVPLKKADLV